MVTDVIVEAIFVLFKSSSHCFHFIIIIYVIITTVVIITIVFCSCWICFLVLDF